METNLGADISGLYNLESATGDGGSSKESGESDFEEKPSKSKDSKLGQKKKEKEDKDSGKKKDKDKGYAALEGESSPEDSEMEVKSPFKGKKRSFKFASRKDKKPKDEEKEKDKKKEKKSSKECDVASLDSKDDSSKLEKSDKKKEKKEKELKSKDKEKEKEKEQKVKDSKGKEIKNKLKIKDKKKTKSNPSLETELPVFGVPLELAVHRSRCHDGIDLPVVVRSCIDYIEENGLLQEGIYRSSGLKTRVMELRRAYNDRENVVLSDIEAPIVASLLKQYLRELPDNILTNELLPKFEDASSLKDPQNQEEIFQHLVQQLPPCNKLLLSWLMIHMSHVIEKERFNKMNVQNLSIVLCPTLNLTHRVMACLFANTRSLFAETQIVRYIPPLSGFGVSLPVESASMAIELKKQESLLAQIHSEMSVGTVPKHREEQLWEAQRIVTQLKRQLRQTAPSIGTSTAPDTTFAKTSESVTVERVPDQTKEVEIGKTDEDLKLDLALPAEPSPEASKTSVDDEIVVQERSGLPLNEEIQPESPTENKTNSKSETSPAPVTSVEIRSKDTSEIQSIQSKPDLLFNAEQDLELALMIENMEREKLIEHITAAIEKERKSIERLHELLSEKSAWTDSSEEDEKGELINEEEQEQLLAEVLRENRELEERNLLLQKQIEETQEICLNYRVQLRFYEEKVMLAAVAPCETIG